MFPLFLLITPLMGLLLISSKVQYNSNFAVGNTDITSNDAYKSNLYLKSIALKSSVLTLFVSLFMFISSDFSTNQFQFVQNSNNIGFFDIYLGVDGLSMYFILLTTIIMPISLLSN